MSSELRTVAILAVYNEADILAETLDHLAAQDVAAYVVDTGSTDGTLDIARSRMGHGVAGIETLTGPPGTFIWTSVLERKQALASQLDADWLIHHDADEFRDPPWPGVTLAQAIARVDEAGFNAIDFALFDFWPVDDSEPPPGGVQSHLRYCEPGQLFNRVQVRCWKRTTAAVDLVGSGGHDAQFDGRRVFPFRFLLRHYPVRSSAHGRRKVLGERIPRYAAEERAAGWHVQYDAFGPESTFVRRHEELTLFDADNARIAVAQQDAERVRSTMAGLERQAESLRAETTASQEVIARQERQLEQVQRDLRDEQRRAAELGAMCRARQADLDAANDALEQAHATLGETRGRLALARADLDAARGDLHATRNDLEQVRVTLAAAHAGSASLQDELRRMYASRTWRWTSGVRRLARLLGLR